MNLWVCGSTCPAITVLCLDVRLTKEHGIRETTIKVKVQPLSAEAFRPYGQVLESRHPVYPKVEGGQSAVMMLRLKQRPQRIDLLAFHFSYNQTFIPVQGAMVLSVAPPPRNRDAVYRSLGYRSNAAGTWA